MTSSRDLEKQIAAEIGACESEKKQATVGNFIFRRKSAWEGECTAAVRSKYADQLAQFAAEDDRINSATDNAFLQLGSSNAKMYLIAAVGLAIIITIVYLIKHKK